VGRITWVSLDRSVPLVRENNNSIDMSAMSAVVRSLTTAIRSNNMQGYF